LPSIAEFIFILILVLILRGESHLLGDGDTGYHIRAGEYIIDNRTIPHHDIFSHIEPPLEWTAHEWLSEVFMALVHRAAGLTGIVVAFATLISLAFFVLFKFLRASGTGILVAAMVVIFAASVSTIHWLARPHVFSLLITLVWYMVLDTHQYREKNRLYLLPPIMLLWVNLHGGFILGLVLIGVYIAGNLFIAIWRSDARQSARRKIKNLSLWFLVCLLATLLNPKGYKILLFPFGVIGNTYLMDHVNEFLSPNFHEHLIYEYMLLFMILVFCSSIVKLNAIEILLVLLFTHMSLYSGRYIPLYAIILSPILARQIDHLLQERSARSIVKRFLRLSARTAETDAAAKYLLWMIGAIVVSIVLVLTQQVSHRFDRDEAPLQALEFIMNEHIPGNMFNDDEFGDHIIYAAWPRYRVFFDGRSDMYGTERLKEYFRVIAAKPGWEEVFKKYDITWVMYKTNSTLTSFLLERKDWHLIYSDKVASIFVKNIPENRYLIEKYPAVKPVIVEEEDDKEKI